MAAFDDFWKSLKCDLAELVKSTMKGYAKQAKADLDRFLSNSKDDLQRWTKMLAANKLTRDDFQWLVLGKRDLAQMEALKQAGLAMIRIKRFQYAVLDLVITAAFKSFT